MSEPNDTREVISAARAELVARGRCRVVPLGDGGRVCLIGALVAATNPAALSEQAYRQTYPGFPAHAAAVTLARHLPEPPPANATFVTSDLFMFNDDRDTTDQDVLNLFDKALADMGGLA